MIRILNESLQDRVFEAARRIAFREDPFGTTEASDFLRYLRSELNVDDAKFSKLAYAISRRMNIMPQERATLESPEAEFSKRALEAHLRRQPVRSFDEPVTAIKVFRKCVDDFAKNKYVQFLTSRDLPVGSLISEQGMTAYNFEINDLTGVFVMGIERGKFGGIMRHQFEFADPEDGYVGFFHLPNLFLDYNLRYERNEETFCAALERFAGWGTTLIAFLKSEHPPKPSPSDHVS